MQLPEEKKLYIGGTKQHILLLVELPLERQRGENGVKEEKRKTERKRFLRSEWLFVQSVSNYNKLKKGLQVLTPFSVCVCVCYVLVCAHAL